jgi:hypothetical protein
MKKLKRIVWLIKTYGVSLPFALHVVFVSDPKIKKEEENTSL